MASDSSTRIIYRIHALQRMAERSISAEEVRIGVGEEIASYPDDTPYPSRLLLGWSGLRPVHVLVAGNADANELIVITCYEPDPTLWQDDFRRRR